MKLSIQGYGIDIELKENQVDVITVENPDAMSALVFDIWRQCNGNDGCWVFSEGEKIIKANKEVELVTNPFAIDVNDKKILSKLYAEMQSEAEESCYDIISNINSDIVNLIDRVSDRLPYPIISDLNIDISGLYKLYNVQIDDQSEGLMEYLINYICLKHRILGVKVFVLINIKQFFSEADLTMLYESLHYNKISIIVVEGVFSERNRYETGLIIDKDLCIIEA